MEVHISFQPQTLFSVLSQDVTNSLFTAIIVLVPLMVLLVFLSGTFNSYNPGKLELFLEMIHESLYGLVDSILGEKYAKKYFAFLLTFFIFILPSNWFPLLPGISSLGIVGEEHTDEASVEYAVSSPVVSGEYEIIQNTATSVAIDEDHPDENLGIGCLLKGECYLTTSGITKGSFEHIFRAPTADLSAGLALAIISVLVTNIVGFKVNKYAYLSKYITFKSPIDFFVGILEIVSELGKVVSFSFRLFGNIFAGEVLLVVVTSISFGLATFPFLGLELFVGLIQALVFFMLTAVFLNLAIQHHHS